MKRYLKAFIKGMGSILDLSPKKYFCINSKGFEGDYRNIRGDFEKVGALLTQALNKAESFNVMEIGGIEDINKLWPNRR